MTGSHSSSNQDKRLPDVAELGDECVTRHAKPPCQILRNHTEVQQGRLPIMSSQALGWEALVVEEYQARVGGMTFQAEVNPVIILILTPQPHLTHETIGSYHHMGIYRQGDICIVPAKMPSSYFAEDSHRYLYIEVCSAFLQRVAQEALDLSPDQLEFRPVFQSRNPQLEQLLRLLKAELQQHGRMGRLYIDSLGNALVVNLLQDYFVSCPRMTQVEGGLGDRQLIQITRYIYEHLDQDIKLSDLAQISKMSQAHFSRLFKQSTGSSPYQYLLQQRVERAKQLLMSTDQSLVEIALACGFSSHSHFTSQFRKITGVTPRDYRTR
jgi:AraC family transcriptional regulator